MSLFRVYHVDVQLRLGYSGRISLGTSLVGLGAGLHAEVG